MVKRIHRNMSVLVDTDCETLGYMIITTRNMIRAKQNRLFMLDYGIYPREQREDLINEIVFLENRLERLINDYRETC